MTPQERIEKDLAGLLECIAMGRPLVVQASGGPTLTIHDATLAGRIVGLLIDHNIADHMERV